MKYCESLRLNIGYTIENIKNEISKKYSIDYTSIGKIEIIKESIDARRKPNIYYMLNVAFELLDDKYDNLFKDIYVSHDGIRNEVLNILRK